MEVSQAKESSALSRNQVTTEQHWAPRSHFKRFQDENGNLRILDKNNWRMCKYRHYSQVCFDEFFFGKKTGEKDAVSQAIENHFNKAETLFEKKYDSIVSNVLSQTMIKEEHLRLLSLYMAKLWIRSNFFRKKTNYAIGSAEKEIIARLARDDATMEEIFKEVEQKTGVTFAEQDRIDGIKILTDKKYMIKYDNTHHLKTFQNLELYANWFLVKKWRFYVAGGELNFFTSDTPVIEVFPQERSFYGTHIAQRKHYFPLSSKILIELSDPLDFGKRVKRKTLNNFEDVLEYNLIRVGWSDEFIYSNTQEDLEYILNNYSPPRREKEY